MALLIVGGTVVDLIFPRVPHLPHWPEHTEFTAANLILLSEPPLVTIGGNGANAAYVAARCGAVAQLHTNIGTDAFGSLARRWLDESGCITRDTPHAGRTAVNVTAANARLQRATLFYPGDAPLVPAPAPGIDHLLVCGWPHPKPDALASSLRAWRAADTRTAVDFGPILGDAPSLASLQPVLDELDLLLANEHELLNITAAADLASALGRLRTAFAGAVVIKRGPDGVTWLCAGEDTPHALLGQNIQAVNTVGAGDTFNGALLAAIGHGTSLDDAMRYADQAACSVVRSPRGVLGLVPPPWPPAV